MGSPHDQGFYVRRDSCSPNSCLRGLAEGKRPNGAQVLGSGLQCGNTGAMEKKMEAIIVHRVISSLGIRV